MQVWYSSDNYTVNYNIVKECKDESMTLSTLVAVENAVI